MNFCKNFLRKNLKKPKQYFDELWDEVDVLVATSAM